MENETEKQKQMERIYIQYHKLMLKVAYDILKNPEDAQDAVQQSFLQLSQHGIEDTEEKRLRCYILTTVRNCAIDMLRKQAMSHSLVFIPQETYIMDHPIHMIDTVMESLPENYRNVLILKHKLGYTSEETARILHLSEVNVIKIDQRAKRKLAGLCRDIHLL